jgi:hypothetical protein
MTDNSPDDTENSPDDARLSATETQMRRALGLEKTSAPRPQPAHPTALQNGFHRPQRHFVRDGEVPVAIIHRDESSGTNQLEAARQNIRSVTAARDTAERSLAEAQATIQQLRTQLGHEHLAKDEIAQRGEAQRQAHEQAIQDVQAELATERAARQQAENRLADASQGRREPTGDHTGHLIQPVSQPRRRGRPRKHPIPAEKTSQQKLPLDSVVETVADMALAAVFRPLPSSEVATDQGATQQPVQARRRGRSSKVKEPEPESEVVEWWKPGWKDRFR